MKYRLIQFPSGGGAKHDHGEMTISEATDYIHTLEIQHEMWTKNGCTGHVSLAAMDIEGADFCLFQNHKLCFNFEDDKWEAANAD